MGLFLPQLTVYSRIACHLCDDLLLQLDELRQQYDFELTMIDVDSHSELQQKYGDKVPVLMADESELCHYYLNPVVVIQYLKNPV